jgi:hypothetical protein
MPLLPIGRNSSILDRSIPTDQAMTKSEFQDLLYRYTSSTRSEAENILLLEKQYPYSQLLHSLAARVSKDHSLATQQKTLQLAAVYAADRHVLKDIMSKSVMITTATHENSVITTHATIDSIDYADEVMHDLKQLHKLKHTFEMLFVDLPKQEIKKGVPVKKHLISKTELSKKVANKTTQVLKKKSKPVAKSKKQPAKKVALEKKSAKVKSKTKQKSKKIKRQSKPVKKNPQTGEELIAQLELTKKKLKPESLKQREQLQIIDQFIKAQPSISQARDRSSINTAQADLVPLKQGDFGEQIISETLVKILISQGKKEKAVEVLKKLIWKFPQKKAYFAAQIEELKN